MKKMLTPKQIAEYYLYRAIDDGDYLTPLKMQKLVFYAYVKNLVKNNKKLFNEKIEAWPSGPVVPSLYQELKKYEAAPISSEFIDMDIEKFKSSLDKNTLKVLDEVYETYVPLSAFELVRLTHSEKPWKNARAGLEPTARTSKPISDEDIKNFYSGLYGKK